MKKIQQKTLLISRKKRKSEAAGDAGPGKKAKKETEEEKALRVMHTSC